MAAVTGNPMHIAAGTAAKVRAVDLSDKPQSSPSNDTAGAEGVDAEALRCLAIRKRLEFDIIKKFDKSDLANKREECFYLMDSKWLNEWSHFVQDPSCTTPPGAVSSAQLLQRPAANALQAGSWGKQAPLKGLQSVVDYRGVSPLTYFIFVELYGRDGSSPDICRYAVDIYLPAVPIEKLVNMQLKASRDAKIYVNKIRPQWVSWELEGDDDEDEGADLLCCGCCGWALTREHVNAFVYWTVHWFSRRKAGRSDIHYGKYKPLSTADKGDSSSAEASTEPAIDELLAEVDTSGPADAEADRGTWAFKQWFRKA